MTNNTNRIIIITQCLVQVDDMLDDMRDGEDHEGSIETILEALTAEFNLDYEDELLYPRRVQLANIISGKIADYEETR